MEEKRNVNKKLLAIFRIYLKLIPIVIAIIYFLNTTLSYFNLYPKVLNYLVFILLIIFVYIASYLLKFCEYHRMFLYYILIVDIINIIDCYIDIPISDFQLLMLHSIITGISLFIILFLYLTINKNNYKQCVHN